VILHPGILALLVGTSIVLAMLLYAGWLGARILARWDFGSSSEAQLSLERRTFLVSTIATYALGFQVASALLFLYTVDDIHALFTGAMCATGSLNAAPGGWAVLVLKIVVVLLSLVWIALNRLDQRAGDFPVVRAKYLGLLVLAPLVAADLALEVRYFSALRPEIITSCCGALFSESGSGVASEVAGLPVRAMLWLFYSTVAGSRWRCCWCPSPRSCRSCRSTSTSCRPITARSTCCSVSTASSVTRSTSRCSRGCTTGCCRACSTGCAGFRRWRG